MEEKILVFEVEDQEIVRKIQLSARMHNMEVHPIPRTSYNQTIGYLAGIPGPAATGAYLGAGLPEPMMVLCMPQRKLEGVLATLRGAGVPPMPKAMLTPTNGAWKPAALLAELRREREEFAKMRK